MKKIYLMFLLISAVASSCKQKPSNVESTVVPADSMVYDSLAAVQAGADEYGMKPYIMAFLKRGPNRDGSKEERDSLQRAHLDNISWLAKEGKLVLAGPFITDGDLRGIYIFDVKTEEEAKKLVETDPAIQAGSLVMELIPWYGSAALTELNERHAIFAKETI